jgi:hypothetical protein
MTVAELTAGFHGSAEFYRAGPAFRRVIYTEGVRAVAETFGAYWLIDAIASHIHYGRARGRLRAAERVVWTLKVGTRAGPERAVLTARRAPDAPILARQCIPYTDFPAEGVEILAGWQPDVDAEGYGIEGGRGTWTLYLPSED